MSPNIAEQLFCCQGENGVSPPLSYGDSLVIEFQGARYLSLVPQPPQNWESEPAGWPHLGQNAGGGAAEVGGDVVVEAGGDAVGPVDCCFLRLPMAHLISIPMAKTRTNVNKKRPISFSLYLDCVNLPISLAQSLVLRIPPN